MKEYGLTPKEQLTLEPYERDHAMILGTYRWNYLIIEYFVKLLIILLYYEYLS